LSIIITMSKKVKK